MTASQKKLPPLPQLQTSQVDEKRGSPKAFQWTGNGAGAGSTSTLTSRPGKIPQSASFIDFPDIPSISMDPTGPVRSPGHTLQPTLPASQPQPHSQSQWPRARFSPSIRSASSPSALSAASREGVNDWQTPRDHASASQSSRETSPSISARVIKKRSSSRLLNEVGSGLRRAGSKMVRKVSSPTLPTLASFLLGGAGSPRERQGKGKDIDGLGGTWEKVPKYAILEGDEGIGVPFNTTHDLHVSTNLDGLPPSWVEELRRQGVSEQDLMLIGSAKQKSASVSRIPLSRSAGSNVQEEDVSLDGTTLIEDDDLLTNGGNVQGVTWKHHADKDPHVEVPASAQPSNVQMVEEKRDTGGSRASRVARTPPPLSARSFFFQRASPNSPTISKSRRSRHDLTSGPTSPTTAEGYRVSKRLSAQIRTFSQLQIGIPDGDWAADLFSSLGQSGIEISTHLKETHGVSLPAPSLAVENKATSGQITPVEATRTRQSPGEQATMNQFPPPPPRTPQADNVLKSPRSRSLSLESPTPAPEPPDSSTETVSFSSNPVHLDSTRRKTPTTPPRPAPSRLASRLADSPHTFGGDKSRHSVRDSNASYLSSWEGSECLSHGFEQAEVRQAFRGVPEVSVGRGKAMAVLHGLQERR